MARLAERDKVSDVMRPAFEAGDIYDERAKNHIYLHRSFDISNHHDLMPSLWHRATLL